jgi:hypothetical protein
VRSENERGVTRDFVDHLGFERVRVEYDGNMHLTKAFT